MTAMAEVVARFEREAVAAGRIEHPNVAPATDFGKLEDGSFYLVLEYVDGKSLRELIAEGPLTWERAVAIARQVTSALVAAHAAGIVHRDLKPDNVMLVPQQDGSERVKVLDFGIARVASTEPQRDATHLTKVGAIMGTVAYMSPEQALGEDVDERTDLYALGVIVHEMISGRVPFDADTAAQILAKQITESPPPLPDSVPAALRALVGELLKKTRIERPPSARVVLERLQALDRPSVAAAASAVSATPARNKKTLLAIAALATLVGLAGALALSGGDESDARPETLPSAESASSATVAPEPSAREKVGSNSGNRSDRAGEDAGVAVEPKVTPSPESTSTSTKSTTSTTTTTTKKTTTKRRTQSTDSDKKKKGPGGIYIPPPSEWF
jgi:serine/threonine-protein kinase